MKKIMLTALLLLGLTKFGHADSTLADQILPSLLQHVVGVTEFTSKGTTKLEFIDGVIQFGHYQKDYIVAIDGGFCNNTTPDASGHLATTWGVHAHVFSALNSFLNINPSLAETLSLLELTPRYSYDTDVKGWVKGITFGARIPFK